MRWNWYKSMETDDMHPRVLKELADVAAKLIFIYILKIVAVSQSPWWSEKGKRHEGGHEPAVCSCSLEGQLYPGLHQKSGGRREREVILPPLLGPCEAPSEVLCPSLRIPEKERHRGAGSSPEESHEDDRRGWSTSLMKKSWKSWACLAWRRKGSRETSLLSSTWRELTSRRGTNFFTWFDSDKTRRNGV